MTAARRIAYAPAPDARLRARDPQEWAKQNEAHKAYLDWLEDQIEAAADEGEISDLQDAERIRARAAGHTAAGVDHAFAFVGGAGGGEGEESDGEGLAGEPKGKPRGKGFQKGHDPRRFGSKPGQGQKSQGGEEGAQQAAGAPKGGKGQQGKGKGENAAQQGAESAGKALGEALSKLQSAIDGAKAGQSPTAPPDLILLRKLNPPLEGPQALGQLGQIALDASKPMLQEVSQRLVDVAVAAVQAARIDVETTKVTEDGKTLEQVIDEKLEARKAETPPPPENVKVTITERKADGTEKSTVAELPGEHTQAVVFRKALQLLGARKHVLLVGPTGSGKTHLSRQLARALKRRFASISCTAGMSESQLTGWRLPVKGGEFAYVPTEFVNCYEGGGVFLLDEIDAADANTLLVGNQATANGHLPLPYRTENPVAAKHPDFALIAAANTWGTGANRMYVGRNQLDDATLDRFRIGTIELDYDRQLESTLIGKTAGAKAFLTECWAIRDRINQHKLRRNLSTRFVIDGWDMIQQAGWTQQDVIGQLVGGWSADERQKAGV